MALYFHDVIESNPPPPLPPPPLKERAAENLNATARWGF